MKKYILVLASAALLSSCVVQQFPVNSTVPAFAHGGEVFGEKTKGQEFSKKRDWFIIGINISNADTKKMAEQIKASSYTIESKSNIISWALQGITFGVVSYKVVKVIKRPN